jgi:hypothetical protein
MRGPLLVFIGTLIWMAALVAESSSQPPVRIGYPQPLLTPAQPGTGDAVSLWLVLGAYPTTCTPTFDDTFRIITGRQLECFKAPCPQLNIIRLMYTEFPPDPRLGRMCGMTVTPYGPRFEFGKLSAGNYIVIDSATNDTVTQFAVSNNQQVSADRSGVQPTRPASDRISYDPHERMLYFRFDKDQNVSIEAYLLDGKRGVNLSTSRFFAAGTYAFSLPAKRFGSGIMAINLKGENFAETRRINLMK